MEIQEAIKSILDGEGMLFTGAGASVSSTNIIGENLKTLQGLTTLLYKRCDMESDGNIAYAAEEFISLHGESELIKILKEQYTVKEVGGDLSVIASVDWKRIYTTNYDNCLQLAYNRHNKLLTTVNLQERPYHFKDKKQLIIHLNGDINGLNLDTLNHSFKLTEPSYVSQDFRDSEWVSLFRQDLNTSSAIFFVGFSLNSDLDLKRIMFASPDLVKKTFFILRENESPATIRNVSRYGTPILVGTKGFADKIEFEKKTFIKKAKTEKKYFCFTRTKFDDLPPDITDKDFYSLIQDGDINNKVLQYSLFTQDDFPYYIFRDKLKTALSVIKNGEKNILITSDTGNGKTLFVKGLSLLLKKEGYNVFEYNRFYSTQDREIEQILALEGKTVLIFESYNHHSDVLHQIENLRSDQIVILTERSIINDVTYQKLEESLNTSVYFMDINILSDDEINAVVQLFNHYGYWGDKANLTDDKKFKFIADSGNQGGCSRSLRLLLLKHFEANNILKKFEVLLSSLRSQKSYNEAFALILVSNVFNFSLQLDDLLYVLDEEILNDYNFRKSTAVREFVNFDEGKIIVKSSIMSEAVLKNIINSHSLIDTLIKVCCRLDKRRDDKNIKVILKEIISFSNLQSILKKDTADYKFNILRFFEGVRNMTYCQNNPHFWLQYAIARLAEREYELADKYFQSAYALSKRRDWFDTYQIDNHYARYLIENEVFYGKRESCMTQFLKAHKILANPLDKIKTRHYPFRVAQNYYPFYQKYYKELPKRDKEIFLHSCKEILQKIEVYLKSIENYRIKKEVEKAKDLLSEIVQKEN